MPDGQSYHFHNINRNLLLLDGYCTNIRGKVDKDGVEDMKGSEIRLKAGNALEEIERDIRALKSKVSKHQKG